MSIKLSHSSMETYRMCPYKYNMHYNKRVRSSLANSALIFGSAIDAALSRILLEKKKILTEEEQELITVGEAEIFTDKMLSVDINGIPVLAKKSDRILYYKNDINLELLSIEDYKELEEDYGMCSSEVPNFIDECFALLKDKKRLFGEDLIIYNNIAWLSLKQKGYMLLEAYRINILPEILEVHTIQKEVRLPNGNGDYIRGYIDLEATFKDGVRRVVDNKTTSIKYKEDSVETSKQLAIYSEFMENRQCAFLVLSKKLKKKAPRVNTQIIFGEVKEEFLEEVFQEVGEIEEKIKNAEFPKNWDKCYQFGRPCPYFAYCRDSTKMYGLEVLKEEESK